MHRHDLLQLREVRVTLRVLERERLRVRALDELVLARGRGVGLREEVLPGRGVGRGQSARG